jgi:CheY-like chemotaxis protein
MKTQMAVLVVDRDADARECLRDLLEAEGYLTMSAPFGKEAQHLVENGCPAIALVGLIAKPTTGLEQLAIVEQEQYFLEIAIEVLNSANKVLVAQDDSLPSVAVESLEERHLFQLAMCSRKPLRPLAKLSKAHAPGLQLVKALTATPA